MTILLDHSNKSERHCGVIVIPYDLLKDILGLPADAHITAIISESSDIGRRQFGMVVDHPKLHAVRPFEMIPNLGPSFEDDPSRPALKLKDWNV
jgi:hypothetical protein